MKKLLLTLLLIPYVLQLSAQNWAETQKISASDRGYYDYFGGAVDIDGDYAIIGAYLEEDSVVNENAGAAYIFERNGSGTWVEVKKLMASDYEKDDEFGFSVAISGNYAVVGAYLERHDVQGGNPKYSTGSAYIFERDVNGNWNQVQKIIAADRNYNEKFGGSVSIDGATILIGAYDDDEDVAGANPLSRAGSAYIFNKNGSGVWIQTQKIVASDRKSYAYFGISVSIEGDKLIAGSSANPYAVISGDTLYRAGAAYIFEKNGSGVWGEVQKICAADRAMDDRFGEAVAISGNHAIVGAWGQDEDETGNNYINNSGAAYIFERSGSGVWNQVKMFAPSDRHLYGGWMGSTVSIHGNKAIAGARFERNNANGADPVLKSGAAYLFTKDISGNWQHLDKIVASDRAQQDEFGYAVAIDGDDILVGAKLNGYDASGNNFLGLAGSAYFFQPDNIGVSENDFSSHLKVYPNPTSGKVTLDLVSVYNGVIVSVVNTLGQTILTTKYESIQNLDFNIKAAEGVYFVKINTDAGNKAVIKILKE